MNLLYPIIQGMRVLRDTNIVHLDMKYQNVLVGRALVPRLTDFG
jgi:serine/threonine protein kinase